MDCDRRKNVSVIVVNWNRRDLLRESLQSLSEQRAAPFEVILVDNGSTDGSVEMAGLEFRSSGAFHLRIIQNDENRGFCAANNQGFAAAEGEFIALLNNDAVAHPDWLSELIRAFDQGEDVGMAASKIVVYENPGRIDKAGHLIYLDGQNRGRGTGEADVGQYDRVEETLWPDGCAAMYRRRMIEEIGGFDEDFFAYGDDAELGLRARIAGWRCVYIPRAVVRHRRGSTLGVGSAGRLELIERNRILLAFKLFPASLLLLNPVFWTARMAYGLLAAARNRGEIRHFPGFGGKLRAAGAILRGGVRALPLLAPMLRKRREIDRMRKLTPRAVRRLLFRYRVRLAELTGQAV